MSLDEGSTSYSASEYTTEVEATTTDDGGSFRTLKLEPKLEVEEPKRLVRHVSSNTRRSSSASIPDMAAMGKLRSSSGVASVPEEFEPDEGGMAEKFVETYRVDGDETDDDIDHDDDDEDNISGAIKESSRASMLGTLRRPRRSSVGTAPQKALAALAESQEQVRDDEDDTVDARIPLQRADRTESMPAMHGTCAGCSEPLTSIKNLSKLWIHVACEVFRVRP